MASAPAASPGSSCQPHATGAPYFRTTLYGRLLTIWTTTLSSCPSAHVLIGRSVPFSTFAAPHDGIAMPESQWAGPARPARSSPPRWSSRNEMLPQSHETGFHHVEPPPASAALAR